LRAGGSGAFMARVLLSRRNKGLSVRKKKSSGGTIYRGEKVERAGKLKSRNSAIPVKGEGRGVRKNERNLEGNNMERMDGR